MLVPGDIRLKIAQQAHLMWLEDQKCENRIKLKLCDNSLFYCNEAEYVVYRLFRDHMVKTDNTELEYYAQYNDQSDYNKYYDELKARLVNDEYNDYFEDKNEIKKLYAWMICNRELITSKTAFQRAEDRIERDNQLNEMMSNF